MNICLDQLSPKCWGHVFTFPLQHPSQKTEGNQCVLSYWSSTILTRLVTSEPSFVLECFPNLSDNNEEQFLSHKCSQWILIMTRSLCVCVAKLCKKSHQKNQGQQVVYVQLFQTISLGNIVIPKVAEAAWTPGYPISRKWEKKDQIWMWLSTIATHNPLYGLKRVCTSTRFFMFNTF